MLIAAISVAALPEWARAQQIFTPSFSSTPVTTATAGAAYSYSITVADLDLLDTITITAPTLPPWLTFTDNGNRTATLTGVPSAANVGPNAVVLAASDGATTANQSFTITVDVDGTPVATADAYTTDEDRRLDANRDSGVLANDTDPNGDQLTAVLVTGVANGTLDLRPDGSFRYEPSANFSGTDTFTYLATDGAAQSAPATVTITVTGANDRPSAVDDAYTTSEDTQLTVDVTTGVLANDTDGEGDTLTAVLTRDVEHGTLALAPNGSFVYTPDANYSGDDEFRYRANDGGAESNEARVRIGVSTGNDLPVAVPDSYSTTADTPLNVTAANGVLANDSDPDGGPLTAVLATNATSGTLALAADGSFSFTPAAAFTGTVTFTYQANDGTGASSAVTVTIEVAASNSSPVAAADSFSTSEDTALTAPAPGVLANDADADGNALTAVLIGNATRGTVSLAADGSFTYTPPQNFTGTATFTYQARDASASSATTTVTITITDSNDPPSITSSPPATAAEGATYTYTMRASDPDGDDLTFAATTLPSWLSFTPPATIRGVPDQDDAGTHAVTMTVSDGTAAPVTQSFEVTVTLVDTPPAIASIPAQTGTEGAPFNLDLKPFVSDPDTPASSIVYAPSGALPAGLALSSAGVVSGAAAPGSYVVRFTARDATTSRQGQFNLTVLAAGRADLAVTIGAAPSPVPVNAVATWTITAKNNASSVAVDALALNATFEGDVPFRFDNPTTAGCTLATTGQSSTLTCALGALAGGASTSVTLTGSGSLAGDVLGSATVAIVGANPIDETPANDRATASLSIAQSVNASAAQLIASLGARAAAAGDLDGDGFDDLAIATGSPQGTIVLMNEPDPANPHKRVLSTTPIVLGGEALGTGVAIVDVDRDSDLDVVVASAAGAPNRIFVNSGGSFASTALGAPSEDSRAVAVGDVNGDGFVDLVFANAGANAVYVNRGSGTAFTRVPFGNGDARDVAVVDLFGDALPEVVVADGGSDTSVYRNNAGALAAELALATGAAASVAAADVNADGRADLVVSRASGGNAVYLNTSGARGEFFLADEFGAAATSDVLLGDFDFDDDADVFAVNRDGDQVYVNAGNGTFALHPQQLQNAGAAMAAAGRFGADERTDVVVIAGGGAAVFFNDGAGNFGQGDTAGPTIQLRGEPTITLNVNDAFVDPGATAIDAADGDVSSRVEVTNPVNTAVIGTYTITYDATDASGNAATPVTRTVQVGTTGENAEGGGGGALRLELLALLAALYAARRVRRRASDARSRNNARTSLSGSPVGTAIGR